jgi:hypothetical protein
MYVELMISNPLAPDSSVKDELLLTRWKCINCQVLIKSWGTEINQTHQFVVCADYVFFWVKNKHNKEQEWEGVLFGVH